MGLRIKGELVSRKIFLSAFMAIVGLGVVSQADVKQPTLINVPLHTGYIPFGFDTNDKVEVVAEGIFSDGCYRLAGIQANVDKDSKVIKLRAQAYKYDGYCIQVVVDYHQEVNLGLLPNGKYKVVASNDEARPLGTLNVALATNSGPDDFLYAPVSQAFYEEIGGKNVVKITGEFTNSCMTLKDTLVQVQSNVIVLQPISEMADRADCVRGQFPFAGRVTLPSMSTGRYLIHTRSLNGRSLNNLVTIIR